MHFVRSLALSLGLLLVGIGLANAHEGNAHYQSTAEDTGTAVLSPEGAALTRSCPGVPGKFCCCGALFALGGTGKAAVIHSAGWTLRIEPTAVPTLFTPLALAPRPAPSLSKPHPRAPPLFS
jgi:hypothetical protein